MVHKYQLVKNYKVEYRQDGLCRFTCEIPFWDVYGIFHPEYLIHTQWYSPAKQKNGNFDRFWFLQRLKELIRIAENDPMGCRTPKGITYTFISPTTKGIRFERS